MFEGLGSLSMLPLEEIPQAPSPSLAVTDGDVSGDAHCTDVVRWGEKEPWKMEGTDNVRIEETTSDKVKTRLLGPSSAAACGGLSAATDALGDEEA
jgi:hypothetical protein